jgi:hypothetical protein
MPKAIPRAHGTGRSDGKLRGEAFQLEYLVYVVVVLAILGLCATLFRPPADASESFRDKRPAASSRPPALVRDSRKVPTPWGWPGGQMRPGNGVGVGPTTEADQGMSSALQIWVDRLIAEKRTIDDGDYLLRKDASLRALLEDRYGRGSGSRAMAYRKNRPPMLQDPQRPPDQMDNFPSGKADRILAGLQRQPQSGGRSRQLGNVKTPWGW